MATSKTPEGLLATMRQMAADHPSGGSWCFEELGYGPSELAHCCVYQSCALHRVGFTGITGANTAEIKASILAHNGKIVDNKWTDAAKPGDVLLFHWDSKTDLHSKLDHVGTLELVTGASTIQCQEGNGNKARKNGTFGRYKANVAYVMRLDWPEDSGSKFTGWWKNPKDGKHYHYTEGVKDTQKWFKGSGDWSAYWFYVGADGAAITNCWFKYKGKYYHFNENGMCQSNAWVQGEGSYAGSWFYLGADGVPVKNEWIKGADGKSWYFCGEDCAMVSGCIIDFGGSLYYFKPNGVCLTNGTVTLKAGEDGQLYV